MKLATLRSDGRDGALIVVAEVGKCGSGGIGGNSLIDGEFLLWVVLLGSGFVLTRDGSIDPPERR